MEVHYWGSGELGAAVGIMGGEGGFTWGWVHGCREVGWCRAVSGVVGGRGWAGCEVDVVCCR